MWREGWRRQVRTQTWVCPAVVSFWPCHAASPEVTSLCWERLLGNDPENCFLQVPLRRIAPMSHLPRGHTFTTMPMPRTGRRPPGDPLAPCGGS